MWESNFYGFAIRTESWGEYNSAYTKKAEESDKLFVQWQFCSPTDHNEIYRLELL